MLIRRTIALLAALLASCIALTPVAAQAPTGSAAVSCGNYDAAGNASCVVTTVITGASGQATRADTLYCAFGASVSCSRTAPGIITDLPLPPRADFTASCSGRICTVDASGSSSGAPFTTYAWSWGNGRGESHTGPTATNTWSSAGTYTVTLTVTDNTGAQASVSKSVLVPGTLPRTFR